MVGEGFEPSKAEPADLQSAPVGHLGTPPQDTNFKSSPPEFSGDEYRADDGT